MNSADNEPVLINKNPITIFSLVMMTVIAIDSLRPLAISAEYGVSLIFYFILGAICFFVPLALVSAELAAGWPEPGGIYIWVREAFGKKCGFFVAWLQWFSNIFWFLTLMSFIAATLAYCINPQLINNPLYMLTVVFCFFWVSTIVNFWGVGGSALFCTITAIAGTLLPMVLVSCLGSTWLIMGKPICLQFSWHHFFPNIININNLVLSVAIIYSLTGMEMSATHAAEVNDPQHDYPKAIFWAAVIILSTLICSSLAIALVIPQQHINIVTALLQAFDVYFAAFHVRWMMPIIAFLIVLSSTGISNTWVLGPSRNLLVAHGDKCLPEFLGYTNKQGMPVRILLLQAVIFTILCVVFFLMPSISSSFWLLTDVAAMLALMIYMLIFLSVVRLRYKYPNVKRSFMIPGGKIGLWAVGGIGSLSCLFALSITFFPPSQIPVGNIITYEAMIGTGFGIACIVPFLLYWWSSLSRKK